MVVCEWIRPPVYHHVTLVAARTASSPWSGCATQTSGVGLSLWQLLGQRQVLLACWAGGCPSASVARPASYAAEDEPTRADLTESY
jgi:hypothetical protein